MSRNYSCRPTRCKRANAVWVHSSHPLSPYENNDGLLEDRNIGQQLTNCQDENNLKEVVCNRVTAKRYKIMENIKNYN